MMVLSGTMALSKQAGMKIYHTNKQGMLHTGGIPERSLDGDKAN